MKSIIKSTLSIAAAAALAGVSIAPAALAWGDNGGGRPSYTIDQINSGVLGDKIVLNSISDSTIGDEKNFVGARLDNGNKGADNVWDGNEITAEAGKTYIVRLYVHNNNPKGEEAVATGVKTHFVIPETSAKSIEVNGVITSDNATPSKYWDDVVFKSDSNFHLEYVKGSALLENNAIGAKGGYKLSDDIVGSDVQIGYDKLDGKIPGCYQYAAYITIKVKVVPDGALLEKEVSKTGESGTWTKSIDANIGDTVYFRIHYRNTSGAEVKSVAIRDILPTNMEYVQGSTKLYNASNPNGIARDDTITADGGVYVGGYANNGDAYVIFAAKVIDKNLACGSNKLVNWGQANANGAIAEGSADVIVAKKCDKPADPVDPADPADPVEDTPEVLPKTGATSVVVTALGLGSVVTTAGYYIASRKALL